MKKWIFVFFAFTHFAATNSQDLTKFDCDAEKMKDPFGYEAVKLLHKSMDDDLSGTVDLSESIDFVRDELRITEKDRMDKRQKAFHHNNDEFITIDDLWCRWVNSEERRWTTDKMIEWLEFGIELPQYKTNFLGHSLLGLTLPRIAVQNTSFLSGLGVTNAVHRQKIQLKAMDAVLFGYRTKSTYWKDVILVTLLCLAVGGYWFAVFTRTSAQREMNRLSNQMDKLKDIETEFQDLQERFHEEKRLKESTEKKADIQEMEKAEQIETLKTQLIQAERLWEKRSPVLQMLLRKTYELEMCRINQQKLASMREMTEARDMVEKFRRKQSSLLNQIRTVHSADMEQIDQRIGGLKSKLEDTAHSMAECQQRWSQIEVLSGFSLTNSPMSHVLSSNNIVASNDMFHSNSVQGGVKHSLKNGVASLLPTPVNYPDLLHVSHAGLNHHRSGDAEDVSEGFRNVRGADLVTSHVGISNSKSYATGLTERPSSLISEVHLRKALAKHPVVFDIANREIDCDHRSASTSDLVGMDEAESPVSPNSVESNGHQFVKSPFVRSDTRDSMVTTTSSNASNPSDSSSKPPKKGKISFFKKKEKASIAQL